MLSLNDSTGPSHFPSPTATGILKGYDQLLNLVLDGTAEHVQGSLPSPLCLYISVVLVWLHILVKKASKGKNSFDFS